MKTLTEYLNESIINEARGSRTYIKIIVSARGEYYEHEKYNLNAQTLYDAIYQFCTSDKVNLSGMYEMSERFKEGGDFYLPANASKSEKEKKGQEALNFMNNLGEDWGVEEISINGKIVYHEDMEDEYDEYWV